MPHLLISFWVLIFSALLTSCGQTGAVSEVKKGIKQYNQGDLNECIETMTGVLISEPKCAACLEYRGFAYKDIGQYDRAIEDFSAHIRLDTTRSAGFINRASVQYLKEEYANALRDFQKALELDPENTSLYNPICHMLFFTGAKDEACEFFHKATSTGVDEFDPKIEAYCQGG